MTGNTLRHTALRVLILAAAILAISGPAALAEEEGAESPVYRALLIACDQFVTLTDMTPIGENNLDIMERMLAEDTRGFQVKRQYGITHSAQSLAYAIAWAFEGAAEEDVSLLYISTHGDFITSHNNPHGELILSDGALEERISAADLSRIFDRIPGTKVLLVDACNSGALIGKGVSPAVGSARVGRTFQSGDYKVLTSSGASEPSWYLLPTLEHAPPGSSYFTTSMAVGAGLIGGYAADINRDGTITLAEMYDYLWTNQASSAVQMLPQGDDYPLFVYDKARLTDSLHGELTGFVFSNTTLPQDAPVLDFGYTVTAPTNVAYRITYLTGGQWDWVHGETLRDVTEFDGDADPMGNVSPGRKQIQLDLTDVLPEDWTYAMIHVMTIGDGEGKQPFIYASRVLRARTDADLNLRIRVPLQWRLKNRPELEIFVAYAAPCSLSLSIKDENGTLVRRIIASRPTRPEMLSPTGSLFYWNGTDSSNRAVPPGKYWITAEARVGGEHFMAEGEVNLSF